MAKGKKGSHYELVLEDRHLIGVFFAVVLLCALFFTLGFVLGRNQVAAKKPASAPAGKAEATTETAAPAADDLSFYDRVEGKQPPETLPGSSSPARKQPTSKPAAVPSPPKASPPPAAAGPAATPTPIYLQVAALTQEPDAKRLVNELRKLGFAALIVPLRDDRFYRVQVGPFESPELAAAAERRLKAQGFRDIIRR